MRFPVSLAASSLLALVTALAAAGCESSENGGATLDPPDGQAPDADVPVPSTCVTPTGAGTVHTSVQGSETWTAAASPHIVDTRATIAAGNTLTLEPCAVVRVKAGMGLLVEGTLDATGEADQPITIERADATAWASIEAREGSSVKLVYTTVEGGGYTNGSDAATVATLDIRGNQDEAAQGVLLADHLTVKGSESLGILLREGGGFAAGSRSLTITGGKGFPLSVWGRAARTLPAGGTFTGNANDEIIIPGNGGRDDIKEDTILADHGVPYRIGGPRGRGNLVVAAPAGGAAPLLTIEPGVTLKLEPAGVIDIDEDGTGAPIGALLAVGTAEKPITFTSAQAAPAAGDWVGIIFEGGPDPRSKIAYAKIAYAGGTSGYSSYGCPSPDAPSFSNEAAIIIADGIPAAGFVANSSIENSAGEGIVRGWTGPNIDLLPTNTFSGIARCNQTTPKPTEDVCPNPAPCPK